MRISRPRRCTRRSPTSTSGRSTKRPIPAPADHFSRRGRHSRSLAGAAVSLCAALALLLAACDDSGGSPTPAASASAAPSAAAPTATAEPQLAALIGPRADLPPNDAIALAARYGRTQGRAPEAKAFAGEANVGERREFAVLDLTAGALSGDAPPLIETITATLRAKSAHAYFFIADELDVDSASVEAAAEMFEQETWPVVTGVFGEPATPGVDGDPRIIVVQAALGGVGGYHSDDDRYLRAVRPLSNEGEIVYLDRTLRAGGAAFNVVLAHELQHLIHGRNDQGEEAWVNEGLSETASGLVGGAVSSVGSFEAQPETQLTNWETGNSLPHYGAGAAFFRYLADRFGGDGALGEIAREGGDGPAGVEAFLAGTGQALAFPEVFADWVAANVLNRADGPYANGSGPREMRIERELATGQPVDDAAVQFGTQYYSLLDLAGGAYELRFTGSTSAPVLPIEAADGALWWSNAEDDINTTLTREVDLGSVTEPVLTFRTWYDIEGWYDWGYVSASTDGGATWQALPGRLTISDDPVKKAYGPGYTVRSGPEGGTAWADERIDLSAYAGRKVLLRLEYVTDGASHGRGWAVDDVRLGGAPLDDAGWEADGFVRLAGALPQSYIVRLMADRAGGEAVVLDLEVDASGSGVLRFNADGLRDAVVAVAGATEGTVATAPYTIELRRP